MYGREHDCERDLCDHDDNECECPKCKGIVDGEIDSGLRCCHGNYVPGAIDPYDPSGTPITDLLCPSCHPGEYRTMTCDTCSVPQTHHASQGSWRCVICSTRRRGV